MTPFKACQLVEGFEVGTEEEILDAWQFLVDTGLAWKLQGWYGRTAMHLIKRGFVSPPEER